MHLSITITHSIFITASPSVVWDFTQDYKKRTNWDHSILEAKVIQHKPFKLVKIRAKGGLFTELKYKLEDRPNKSSLAMINVKSFIIQGGGGSWRYEADDSGTLWTQTNTLIVKKYWILLVPIIKRALVKNTIKGMKRAKQMIEV